MIIFYWLECFKNKIFYKYNYGNTFDDDVTVTSMDNPVFSLLFFINEVQDD